MWTQLAFVVAVHVQDDRPVVTEMSCMVPPLPVVPSALNVESEEFDDTQHGSGIGAWFTDALCPSTMIDAVRGEPPELGAVMFTLVEYVSVFDPVPLVGDSHVNHPLSVYTAHEQPGGAEIVNVPTPPLGDWEVDDGVNDVTHGGRPLTVKLSYVEY